MSTAILTGLTALMLGAMGAIFFALYRQISRIGTRLDKLAKRPYFEAAGRLLAPELDETDLRLLSIDQLDTEAPKPKLRPKPFPRKKTWTEKAADADAPYARYVGQGLRTIEPSAELPAPTITVDAKGEYPEVSVPEARDAEGREAHYYFEFDTSPDFDTPNFWRYPALGIANHVPDITSRHGLKFWLLRTPHRNTDGRERRVRFPFRATAMRLPGWKDLTFRELERHARALAHGLKPEAAIQEVFNYVRQTYYWAHDTKHRTPLDTFAAGLAACGHVNDLAGAMLEMNGIRYRGVGGFPPKARALLKGNGGHSAIEVLNPRTGKWGYFDPYLDFLAVDVQARDLKDVPLGQTETYRLAGRVAAPVYKDYVNLGELFTYRLYFDKLRRQRPMSSLQLGGSSDTYGKDWPLNQAPEFARADLFPEEIRIFVRARYGFAGDAGMERSQFAGPLVPIRVTPWATTSFTVRPHARAAAIERPAAAERRTEEALV